MRRAFFIFQPPPYMAVEGNDGCALADHGFAALQVDPRFSFEASSADMRAPCGAAAFQTEVRAGIDDGEVVYFFFHKIFE